MKNAMHVAAGGLALGLLLALVPAATAQHVAIASRPRDVYFEMPTSPTKTTPPHIALRVWIELHPRSGGTSTVVPADHVFHSGDRTRYRVAANTDCRVYIAFRGSSGRRALFFPSIPVGRDNRLRRHEPKTIPSNQGFITFDDRPGEEHLIVVAAPERIDALETLAQRRVGANPTTTSLTLSDDEERVWSDLQKQWTGQPEGQSTQTVLTQTERTGPNVGSYYCEPQAFRMPVVFSIPLKHER